MTDDGGRSEGSAGDVFVSMGATLGKSRQDTTAPTAVRMSRETHAPGAFESTLEGMYMLALAEHPMAFRVRGPVSRYSYSIGRCFSCFRRPSTSIEIDFLEDPASNIFVSISADWAEQRFDEAGVVAAKIGDFVEHVDPILMTIVEKLRKAESSRGADALESQFLRDRMIHHLAGRHSDRISRGAGVRPPRWRSVLEHIDAHLSEELSLDNLAAVAGLSRFEFARSFAAQTGIPPHRYVMLRRTEAAITMIRGDSEELSDIAAAAGFYDQAHMSRWISQEALVSPSKLRDADVVKTHA